MDNLRSIISTKVLSNIPPHVKPIDYLMDTLNISRESVYRRIRGDISFTLEEIAKLSIDLGFSIDELIIKDMPSRIFFDLHITCKQDPSETYINFLQQYFQSALGTTNVKDIELMMIINHLPPEFIIFSNQLFKFSYYRWMHQSQESSLKYFYSDVIIPDKLIFLQQKAIEGFKRIRNSTFIFDSNVFLNLIQEIQYYFKRRLINENEIQLLKTDLFAIVDMLESITQTGYFDSDSKYNIYLSSLNVESSSRYIKFDKQAVSQFLVNSMEPMTITNLNLCDLHKKWLDSMRKYATLITQSNEILQVRYFNKQRSHIEEITNFSSIVSF